jgi:hypothetical protein
LKIRKTQGAVGFTTDHRAIDPGMLQGPQWTHHRIVLKATYHDMITRTNETLNCKVEGMGGVQRKSYSKRIRNMEQFRH